MRAAATLVVACRQEAPHNQPRTSKDNRRNAASHRMPRRSAHPSTTKTENTPTRTHQKDAQCYARAHRLTVATCIELTQGHRHLKFKREYLNLCHMFRGSFRGGLRAINQALRIAHAHCAVGSEFGTQVKRAATHRAHRATHAHSTSARHASAHLQPAPITNNSKDQHSLQSFYPNLTLRGDPA